MRPSHMFARSEPDSLDALPLVSTGDKSRNGVAQPPEPRPAVRASGFCPLSLCQPVGARLLVPAGSVSATETSFLGETRSGPYWPSVLHGSLLEVGQRPADPPGWGRPSSGTRHRYPVQCGLNHGVCGETSGPVTVSVRLGCLSLPGAGWP